MVTPNTSIHGKEKNQGDRLGTEHRFCQSYEALLHAVLVRLDRLENKLEILVDKVIGEMNNKNKPKDLPMDNFFSRFCALKGLDEEHLTARA